MVENPDQNSILLYVYYFRTVENNVRFPRSFFFVKKKVGRRMVVFGKCFFFFPVKMFRLIFAFFKKDANKNGTKRKLAKNAF